MPIRPCPTCGSNAPRRLEANSAESWANYYRCQQCACVWTIPKDAPDVAPHIVAYGRRISA